VEIDFALIIELQRLDSEIHNASLVLEGIPRLVQDVDKKMQATTKLVADAKDKMAQNQKKRRDLESEVKDLKVAIGKYKR
jgi:peptidoglycan hydrolase CwlO-like protein